MSIAVTRFCLWTSVPHLGVVRRLFDDLGRHPEGRADERLTLAGGVGQLAGHAEIRQLHITQLREQHVGRCGGHRGCQPRHPAQRAARSPLWGTQGDVSHVTQLREQHFGRCGGHRGMSATSPSSESSTLAAVGDTGGVSHVTQLREQHVGRRGGHRGMSATSPSSESSTLAAVGDTGGVSHVTQLREQHVRRCGGHRGMSATSPSSESSTLAAVGDTGGCQPRPPAQRAARSPLWGMGSTMSNIWKSILIDQKHKRKRHRA